MTSFTPVLEVRQEFNHTATGSAARSFRRSRNLSVREVARRLGYSAAFVSDLELGRRCWTREKVEAYNRVVQRT